jgi:Protein of unknown function (DUF3052)
MPDKTLAQKMYIKDGHKVLLVKAPKEAEGWLGGLPAGATLVKSAKSDAGTVVVFAKDRKALETDLPKQLHTVAPDGSVWVAYHKGTSKVKTDINRDTIAAYAETLGLNSVAMVAINEDWAALRLKMK